MCIKDKIVQQAIKTAIEPQLEKTFLNLSYGYRPNKGPERGYQTGRTRFKEVKEWLCSQIGYRQLFRYDQS